MVSDDILTYVTQSSDGGAHFIQVTTRRTYALANGRRCEVSPRQSPLSPAIEYYEDRAGQGGAILPRTDPDLFAPLKLATDVVVQGNAWSPSGLVPQLDVSVAVLPPHAGRDASRAARVMRVVGDRRVEWRGEGNAPTFTPPTPFSKMPLTYDRAYGGRDLWGERTHPDENLDWFQPYTDVSKEELSPYNYARNPAGRGYVVFPDRAAFDALQLPNLELPGDLLTPERLCSGDANRWPMQPVPAGFDWCEQSWFPRFAFLGMGVAHGASASDFVEVRSGYLSAEHVMRNPLESESPITESFDDRIYNGASPWLILPRLTGAERVVLTNLHRVHSKLEFELPGERPQVLVDVPGRGATELPATLGTVLIEPDEDRVSLVWGARLAIDLPITEQQEESLRYAVRWRSA